MTVEEAKKTLGTMIFAIDCPEPKISIGDMADVREALSMAIRSLEAWEIIKEEVLKTQTYKMFEGDTDLYVERKDVLKIIDKYLKEVEK